MTIDMGDTAAIDTPSAPLSNLDAAMSLALRKATRPHPCRLCLVFDEAHRNAVHRLLATESVHSTFLVVTFGEPKHSTFGEPRHSTFGEPNRGHFTVDIEVPHTHTGILDTLTSEVTARGDQLTAAAS